MQNRNWQENPVSIHPPYKSSVYRNPHKPLIPIPEQLFPDVGPVYGCESVDKDDHDLTVNGRVNGEPLGERMILFGRITDAGGNPVKNTLIEIWQCNSAGRYVHKQERHDAPLDPNFLGAGRTLTDTNGYYKFITIVPGAYPWGNHHNAWRPAHIHFSLFGDSIRSRLITQMYFERDPLFPYDPIFNAMPENIGRRLIAKFSMQHTVPDWALAFEFNIVLRGKNATPFEHTPRFNKE